MTGWIVDIGMVGLGVVALGVEAVAVAREIQAFAQGVIKAQNEGDLIAAGRHLGQAVAIVGVDVVVALLLKKAVVKVREPKLRLTQEAPAQRLLFGKYDPGKAQARLAPEVVEATSPQAAKRANKNQDWTIRTRFSRAQFQRWRCQEPPSLRRRDFLQIPWNKQSVR